MVALVAWQHCWCFSLLVLLCWHTTGFPSSASTCETLGHADWWWNDGGGQATQDLGGVTPHRHCKSRALPHSSIIMETKVLNVFSFIFICFRKKEWNFVELFICTLVFWRVFLAYNHCHWFTVFCASTYPHTYSTAAACRVGTRRFHLAINKTNPLRLPIRTPFTL